MISDANEEVLFPSQEWWAIGSLGERIAIMRKFDRDFAQRPSKSQVRELYHLTQQVMAILEDKVGANPYIAGVKNLEAALSDKCWSLRMVNGENAVMILDDALQPFYRVDMYLDRKGRVRYDVGGRSTLYPSVAVTHITRRTPRFNQRV